MNRKDLQKKLSIVTTELIQDKGDINFVDVYIKLGYLDTHLIIHLYAYRVVDAKPRVRPLAHGVDNLLCHLFLPQQQIKYLFAP